MTRPTLALNHKGLNMLSSGISLTYRVLGSLGCPLGGGDGRAGAAGKHQQLLSLSNVGAVIIRMRLGGISVDIRNKDV